MGKSKAKKKSNKATVSAAKPAEKTVVSTSKPEVKAKKKRVPKRQADQGFREDLFC